MQLRGIAITKRGTPRESVRVRLRDPERAAERTSCHATRSRERVAEGVEDFGVCELGREERRLTLREVTTLL